MSEKLFKYLLLPGLVVMYGLLYAPYGINETDGGFITGLAWQLLQGKQLYTEVIYVRPPIPVWLQAACLRLTPDDWEVLGERWMFYLKVMLYCWWGAGVLWSGKARIWYAAFAYVLSAHNYPAAAWHTVDGIFFAALGLYLWFRHNTVQSAWLAGFCIGLSVMCKQSFYPLAMLMPAMVWWTTYLQRRSEKREPWTQLQRLDIWFYTGLAAGLAAVIGYLQYAGSWPDFLELSSASAGAWEAIDHGVLDYFRVDPVVLLGSLLGFGVWFWKRSSWTALLLPVFLGATYLVQVARAGDFVVPIAQSRVLFWLAVYFLVKKIFEEKKVNEEALRIAALLAIAWCASISWGYNFPLLFAVPLVCAVGNVECRVSNVECRLEVKRSLKWGGLVMALGLFGFAYQFIYRDGPRREMETHMGDVFPRLKGIYSNASTAELYRELAELNKRYGKNSTVLPAFSLVNYLNESQPPLPLDWVVERETGGRVEMVINAAESSNPYFFIEKSYGERLLTDPEFAFTKTILEHGQLVNETPYFLIYRIE